MFNSNNFLQERGGHVSDYQDLFSPRQNAISQKF